MNLISDCFHNFIDGALICGSYLVDYNIGVATTIAVILHEIPQEIGDFGILLNSGFSKKSALLFNLLSASSSIFGCIIAYLISKDINNFTNIILAFTAGSFIYIAVSDLIPDLHKETKISKSLVQIIGIILGILVMLNIGE